MPTMLLLLGFLALPVFVLFYMAMTHFRVSEVDRLTRIDGAD